MNKEVELYLKNISLNTIFCAELKNGTEVLAFKAKDNTVRKYAFHADINEMPNIELASDKPHFKAREIDLESIVNCKDYSEK